MQVYDNYTLDTESDHVVFSARALTVVELVGTVEYDEMSFMPAQWNDMLHSKIDFEKYNQYRICTYGIQHGFYNCLTDRKGLWKQTGIPCGIANTLTKQVGVKFIGVLRRSIKSINGMILAIRTFLLPKGDLLPVDALKRLWKENQIGFDVKPNGFLFRKLLALMPNSYPLYIMKGLEHKLEIYGLRVEQLFDVNDMKCCLKAMEMVGVDFGLRM